MTNLVDKLQRFSLKNCGKPHRCRLFLFAFSSKNCLIRDNYRELYRENEIAKIANFAKSYSLKLQNSVFS